MAILSSREGKFYEIPDADLKKHEVPAAKVKQIMAELDAGGEGGPGVEPYALGGPAQVVIYVNGSGASIESGPPEGPAQVEPYGYGYGGGYGHYGWGHSPWWPRRRRRYYYGY